MSGDPADPDDGQTLHDILAALDPSGAITAAIAEHHADTGGGTFQVTMLDVLRGPFERWLAERGLLLALVSDTSDPSLIVIPDPQPDADVADFGAGWAAKNARRRAGCTADALHAAVGAIVDRHPGAALVRTRAGNMRIVDDGTPVGHLDLTYGRAVWERR